MHGNSIDSGNIQGGHDSKITFIACKTTSLYKLHILHVHIL